MAACRKRHVEACRKRREAHKAAAGAAVHNTSRSFRLTLAAFSVRLPLPSRLIDTIPDAAPHASARTRAATTIMATGKALAVLAVLAVIAGQAAAVPARRLLDDGLQDAGWTWHYELTVAGKPGSVAVVSDARVTNVVSGCGSDNQKCSCTSAFDQSGFGKFIMDGTGTSGTLTGLDFTCDFKITFIGGTQPFPTCQCTAHIDNPHSGSNEWSISCNPACVAGFAFQVPDSGHALQGADTVRQV